MKYLVSGVKDREGNITTDIGDWRSRQKDMLYLTRILEQLFEVRVSKIHNLNGLTFLETARIHLFSEKEMRKLTSISYVCVK